MSILIPGMKMPRKGEMLVIFPDGTSYVCFNGRRERLAQTKAVPVPPHGRLGDLDAMAAKDTAEYEEAMNFAIDLSTRTLFDCTHREVQKAIKNAPTIIPPEGGADG